MINVFNEIYTELVATLTAYDTKIKSSSVYVNMPSEYPFVSLEEISDRVYERGMDDTEIENFDEKDFEINIYTQGNLKKSEGDNIANVVDSLFKSLGFVRQSKTPLQDTNETIYRIVMRYSGIVSKDHIVYRR